MKTTREHALAAIESNGERSRQERSWTATCRCGWQESASTKAETMREYRAHRRAPGPKAGDGYGLGYMQGRGAS